MKGWQVQKGVNNIFYFFSPPPFCTLAFFAPSSKLPPVADFYCAHWLHCFCVCVFACACVHTSGASPVIDVAPPHTHTPAPTTAITGAITLELQTTAAEPELHQRTTARTFVKCCINFNLSAEREKDEVFVHTQTHSRIQGTAILSSYSDSYFCLKPREKRNLANSFSDELILSCTRKRRSRSRRGYNSKLQTI